MSALEIAHKVCLLITRNQNHTPLGLPSAGDTADHVCCERAEELRIRLTNNFNESAYQEP